eukprot:CAMPEP_0172512848 /NCGR_PEP_ID=MMETSP1066-20121228/247668_1 /TAXON_ID=671091 /ORGANISM="Coscinodiscus wailesii, Strain CCMP2513" /LENGTH=160 /DNA_ID=CAMNT_0013292829 /DNA_START=102 /DNA_END=584 /DNA_ORIENTATION=-
MPKSLYREFEHVFRSVIENFPETQNTNTNNDNIILAAIPTNQNARHDLVAVGSHIEDEKDRLLNNFLSFARDFCERVTQEGHWADFIDPCSGLPMLSKYCNKVYSEVDGMEVLLNYKSYNAGFCKILTHPKWGSAVYPATIFARAPEGVLRRIITSYPEM